MAPISRVVAERAFFSSLCANSTRNFHDTYLFRYDECHAPTCARENLSFSLSLSLARYRSRLSIVATVAAISPRRHGSTTRSARSTTRSGGRGKGDLSREIVGKIRHTRDFDYRRQRRESYFSPKYHSPPLSLSLARAGICKNALPIYRVSLRLERLFSVPSSSSSPSLGPTRVAPRECLSPTDRVSIALCRARSLSLSSSLLLLLTSACPTTPLCTHPRTPSSSRAPQSLPLPSRSVPWPRRLADSFCTRDDDHYDDGCIYGVAYARFFRWTIGHHTQTDSRNSRTTCTYVRRKKKKIVGER